MAKFETVPIGELKHRLPAKLLPLVEEYKDKLEKLQTDQGGKLVLEKGDDAKELRRALKAAAGILNRRIRFPFRGGTVRSVSILRASAEEGGGGRRASREALEARPLVGSGGGRGKRAHNSLPNSIR
jgi:hypothetical protein